MTDQTQGQGYRVQTGRRKQEHLILYKTTQISTFAMQKSIANHYHNRNRAHVFKRANQPSIILWRAPFECNSEQQSMEKGKGARRINNKLLDYNDTAGPEPRYFHYHMAWP